MKTDIEGSEVDLIEKFLDDDPTNQICFWHNQICFWHVVWIEYHAQIFKKDTPEREAHAKFHREFPERFQQKCGRMLRPMFGRNGTGSFRCWS
jgi:hypothetical protein